MLEPERLPGGETAWTRALAWVTAWATPGTALALLLWPIGLAVVLELAPSRQLELQMGTSLV